MPLFARSCRVEGGLRAPRVVSVDASEQHADPGRFRDPRSNVYDYMSEILVRCPRCGQKARVAPNPSATPNERSWFTARRVSCLSCAYSSEQTSTSHLQFRGGRDPYFGLQLWLSADCAGQLLWAYNFDHLDLLESFVAADLRERGGATANGPSSLVERLPSWMKQAKHREEIIKTIKQLRTTTS